MVRRRVEGGRPRGHGQYAGHLSSAAAVAAAVLGAVAAPCSSSSGIGCSRPLQQ